MRQLRNGRTSASLGPTDVGQTLMSTYQLGFNRYLGILVIAVILAYLALGLSFVPNLLPTSAIAILLNGVGTPKPLQ